MQHSPLNHPAGRMFQNKMLYPLIFELGTEYLLIGEGNKACWLMLAFCILPGIDRSAQRSHRQHPLHKNKHSPKNTNLVT